MSEWIKALDMYQKKELTKEQLWPFWREAAENLAGLLLGPERVHQAEPLFKHGWSPNDASDHLRRVWALKGWL